MIAFHEPTLSDQAWVLPLLRAEGLSLCDYTFPVLFCWKDAYRFKLAQCNRRLLVRLRSSVGHAYLWPVGEGDPTPAITALQADAAAHGEPLRLIGLTLYHRNWLEANFPGQFTFTESRDAFDYLYSVDRLADLPGKKLHAKRNHIHRFAENCPGWSFVPLAPEDVSACLTMDKMWHQDAMDREGSGDLTSLADEQHALRLALQNLTELGLEGGAIRCGSQVIAFTLGAPLSETVYDVHFERARGEIQGAYAAINQSFAQYIRQRRPKVRYLNREDDMGIEGLRKAKLSYYPDYLEVKFCAVNADAASQ